jgi:pentatricopeptide repeat protein
LDPHNPELQNALAQALIENGRYDEAYQRYQEMLAAFPRNADALVNYGLLAAKFGHPNEAVDAWSKAVAIAPDQPNAHLYLAETYDQNRQPAAAVPNWRAFLRFAAAHPDDPAAGRLQQISATIRLADDDSAVNGANPAQSEYLSAVALAERMGDTKLASLALVHLADLQDRTGDVKSAAESYQRALALDAKANDPHAEASDWFNYGQFLRRHGLPDVLAYACVLHAEQLLASSGGPDLETVKKVRSQMESHLPKRAAVSQKNLPALLVQAADLPASSF